MTLIEENIKTRRDKEPEKGNDEETVKTDSKKNIANVMYIVNPLYNIQKWFGISIFQLVNGEIIPTNWKTKVFGISIVLAYCILFICSVTLPQAVATMTLEMKLVYIPGIFSVIQYLTSSITTSFLVDTININFLTAFAELDTLLRVETIHDCYKKSRSSTTKFLIALFVTHIINSALSLATASEINMAGITVLPLDVFQKLQIIMFCRVILLLRSRLMLINEYVTTFIENRERKNVNIFTIRERKVASEGKFNFIGRASDNNTKIRDLATMYDLMGKICAMINEAWNFKILMTLITTFAYIVITMWTSLSFYKVPENKLGALINVSIWCFSAIYTVAIMSFTCEKLLQVRNETKVIVNKVIMNYDLPKTMRVQAKAFMELIEAWPLRVYIYDMFSVDITLMLKFISVATTYLIVIIQISHFF